MKRITAIILTLMFAVALVVPMSAAGEINFYAEADPTTDLKPGDTVEVTASIDDNPGLAGVIIFLTYDEDAFYIANEDEDIFDTGRTGSRLTLLAYKVGSPECTLSSSNVGFTFAQASNTTRNGGLFTIVFTVKDDAPTGNYDFDIEVKQVSNAAREAVPFTITNDCTVSVDGVAPQPSVSVDMAAATEDGNEVAANLYVNIPAGDVASDYTVSVNGNESTLGNDQKVSYAVAAKKMGDPITIEITKGGTSVYSGTTSVKAYCEDIAAGNYSDEVKQAARTMLVYGAAAQKYFNYNTDALVTEEVCGIPVAANRFDASGLRAALKDAPVEYTSINAQFLADTSLLIALKVKDASNVDAAKEWVDNNVGIEGGATTSIMSNSNSGAKFIVITKSGITIDKVCDDFGIAVEGNVVGTISVDNYLAAVEATYAGNAAKANFLELARALFAYAQAVECLA